MRHAEWPELRRSLYLAKVTGATLAIARVDRLSRNAANLLRSMDGGVRLLAVDLPEANDLTAGNLPLMVQQQREAISRRTKGALALAKAQRVRLGGPDGVAALRRAEQAAEPIRATVVRNAYRYAAEPTEIAEDVRASGAAGLRTTAAKLNAPAGSSCFVAVGGMFGYYPADTSTTRCGARRVRGELCAVHALRASSGLAWWLCQVAGSRSARISSAAARRALDMAA